jgi:SOS-response transcriptional repressor LexA
VFSFCQEKKKHCANKHSANLFPMELTEKERQRYHSRLREELRRRGLDKNKDIAAILGISPAYVGQIFNNEKSGARKVFDFAKRLKVPIGYLLGIEELPGLKVPLVSGRIAASPTGQIPGEAIEKTLWLPFQLIGSRDNLVAVRLGAEAHSMFPNLRPGDLAIIDRGDRELVAQGIYAVRLDDLESCTLKRLHRVAGQEMVLLISDNPEYPPKSVPWHEHLIIGRLIWSWTDWMNL